MDGRVSERERVRREGNWPMGEEPRGARSRRKTDATHAQSLNVTVCVIRTRNPAFMCMAMRVHMFGRRLTLTGERTSFSSSSLADEKSEEYTAVLFVYSSVYSSTSSKNNDISNTATIITQRSTITVYFR